MTASSASSSCHDDTSHAREKPRVREEVRPGLPDARTPALDLGQGSHPKHAAATELQEMLCGRSLDKSATKQGPSFVLAPLVWWSLAELHYKLPPDRDILCITRNFLPLEEHAFVNPNPDLRQSVFKRAEARRMWLPLLRRADVFLASSQGRRELQRSWATLLRHPVRDAAAVPPSARNSPTCALVSLLDKAVGDFVRLTAANYKKEHGRAMIEHQVWNLQKILFTFHGFVPVLPSVRDEESLGTNLERAGVVPHVNALFLQTETKGPKQAKDLLASDLSLLRVLTTPLQVQPPSQLLRDTLAQLDKEILEAAQCDLEVALAPWVMFMSAFPPCGIAETYSQKLSSGGHTAEDRIVSKREVLAKEVKCGKFGDTDLRQPSVVRKYPRDPHVSLRRPPRVPARPRRRREKAASALAAALAENDAESASIFPSSGKTGEAEESDEPSQGYGSSEQSGSPSGSP